MHLRKSSSIRRTTELHFEYRPVHQGLQLDVHLEIRTLGKRPLTRYRNKTNMPGSAQAPWATELKTRKKSIPRKRSVNSHGKKAFEDTVWGAN